MRILQAHNRIGSSAPSGENVVVAWERDLLVGHGHEVRTFERSSDDLRNEGGLGALKGGLLTPWNPFAAASIRRAAREFRPDIVHVHNTFPLLSPAVFAAAAGLAARVLTLHNFGLFCASALPLRDGQVCTECLDRRSALPALRYGCYRGSRAATVPRAASVMLHRRLGTWQRHVDAFVALTAFQRDRVVAAGLQPELVHVRPNFIPGAPRVVPWEEREPFVVFAGRLSREKGAATLIRAWNKWGEGAPELRIVGDGPDRLALERLAGHRVRFLGLLAGEHARRQIATARLAVLPSEVYEGFPVVLQEAFAYGTPVAVSDVGPLPDLVHGGAHGAIFRGWDAAALLDCVRVLWQDEPRLRALGDAGRAAYEGLYTEEVSYGRLLEIYEAALEVAARRAGKRKDKDVVAGL
jgi:glycosyltransferase involved in cell wall biosynthesis